MHSVYDAVVHPGATSRTAQHDLAALVHDCLPRLQCKPVTCDAAWSIADPPPQQGPTTARQGSPTTTPEPVPVPEYLAGLLAGKETVSGGVDASGVVEGDGSGMQYKVQCNVIERFILVSCPLPGVTGVADIDLDCTATQVRWMEGCME